MTALSKEFDCPVFVLAHPSKAGMDSGDGSAGSVHWANSARFVMYLENIYAPKVQARERIEPNTNARRLSDKKSNYSGKGTERVIEWADGIFHFEAPPMNADGTAIDRTLECQKLYLEFVRIFTENGTGRSPHPSKSGIFKNCELHPNSGTFNAHDFRMVHHALMAQGKVRIGKEGKPSRQKEVVQINPEYVDPQTAAEYAADRPEIIDQIGDQIDG